MKHAKLILLWAIAPWINICAGAANVLADTQTEGIGIAMDSPADTVYIIENPTTPMPDDIYGDPSLDIENDNTAETVEIASGAKAWKITRNAGRELAVLGDNTHNPHWLEAAVPGALLVGSALMVKTPALVKAREKVQEHLSNHGKNKTSVDNYLQYAPMVEAYALQFCGYKGQHSLIDRTLLLGLSYVTFAVTNNAMKYTFREKRPDSSARNSFPSGHTGTVVTGAEFLRREYWHRNKWVAMSGYAFAATVAYLRIYNDRHWINDVIGGAALGYLSTTFAYWIYPKIFRRRTQLHRDRLLEQLPSTEHRQRYTSWVAAPYFGSGNFGVSASVTF